MGALHHRALYGDCTVLGAVILHDAFSQVAALAHSASVSGLTQQQAAVAHDLVANWRLHVLDVQASAVCVRAQPVGQQRKASRRPCPPLQHHSQDNTLNFPAVGYRQDEALMGQLRSAIVCAQSCAPSGVWL